MTTSPGPARQRWLIPALIVVLSLTIGGGLLARELYQPPDLEPVNPAPPTVQGSLPAAEQPGSSTVELTTDAADHPQGQGVRTLLQNYFNAINDRDYPKWTAAVTAERRQTKTRTEWLADFKSTKDGSILVYRIDTVSPGQLRVLVALTSTQNESDAPVGLPATCVRWRLALPVVMQDGGLRIDVVLAGAATEREKC
jgi:hypothetical protein